MKFTIKGESFDTNKMNKFEIRATISRIQSLIHRGYEAQLETVKTLDQLKIKLINDSMAKLQDIIDKLKAL